MSGDGDAVAAVRDAARPLTGTPDDLDELFDCIGDARFVLLGEASHGTTEFYRERRRLTERLVTDHGFAAVVVEADWPDAYRAGCWAQCAGGDASADEALGAFRRFPTWMWRNTEIVELLTWLRTHNAHEPDVGRRVGFYGLDLYSLFTSMASVIDYLERVDRDAAARARQRYACFDHIAGDDAQAYGAGAAHGAGPTCEDEVVEQLVDLCRRLPEITRLDGGIVDDEAFHAEQSARLVVNAERYYRAMFEGRVSTWNLRDTHMADTLDALADHLSRRRGRPARVVVWEHNSHVGDARATEMGRAGEVTVGQLVRERHPGQSFHVGFTTSTGTVAAADDWGGTVRRKRIHPPLPDSHEAVLHGAGVPSFWLPVRDDVDAAIAEVFRKERLERAIGVIYRPQTERVSHWFGARLADQFDAVVHIDETTALEPLDPVGRWDAGEAPDTFPTGI